MPEVLAERFRWFIRQWDAFEYAREHKEEQVVFLSVGFETTTPAAVFP